jgi:hypothetical protein
MLGWQKYIAQSKQNLNEKTFFSPDPKRLAAAPAKVSFILSMDPKDLHMQIKYYTPSSQKPCSGSFTTGRLTSSRECGNVNMRGCQQKVTRHLKHDVLKCKIQVWLLYLLINSLGKRWRGRPRLRCRSKHSPEECMVVVPSTFKKISLTQKL